MRGPICVLLRWFPWVRCEDTPTDSAKQAEENAARKLDEANELAERVDAVANRLAARVGENHFRIRMEQAFRGHGP